MASRGLTLDSGALIAYEGGQQRMRALIVNARDADRPITIPTVVLAETFRGQGSRWIDGLLGIADVEPLTATLARRAGELLARTGTRHTVDAIVAASAAQRGDLIVTSDPEDLQIYADDLPAIAIVRA